MLSMTEFNILSQLLYSSVIQLKLLTLEQVSQSEEVNIWYPMVLPSRDKPMFSNFLIQK